MTRIAPLSGLAFAIAFVAGLFMDNGPSQDLSDAATAQWYQTHSLVQWLLSAGIIALAALLAIAFTVSLTRRIDPNGRTGLIAVSGGVAAAVLLTAAAVYGSIPARSLFNATAFPSADVSRGFPGLAYAAMVLAAPLAFGLMMAAVAVIGWTRRTLPRWLAILTIPFAVAQLFNFVAPMMSLAVWCALTAVTLTVLPLREGVAAVASRRAVPVAS